MSADLTADNGNGRVTLAVLGEQMRTMIQALEVLNRNLERHVECDDRAHSDLEKRVRDQEKGAATREQKLLSLDQDVAALKSKDTFGTLITGALAMIAGAIGLFKP